MWSLLLRTEERERDRERRIWNSPLSEIRSRLTRLRFIHFHAKLFPHGLITRRRRTRQHCRLHVIIPRHLNKFDSAVNYSLSKLMNETDKRYILRYIERTNNRHFALMSGQSFSPCILLRVYNNIPFTLFALTSYRHDTIYLNFHTIGNRVIYELYASYISFRRLFSKLFANRERSIFHSFSIFVRS